MNKLATQNIRLSYHKSGPYTVKSFSVLIAYIKIPHTVAAVKAAAHATTVGSGTDIEIEATRTDLQRVKIVKRI